MSCVDGQRIRIDSCAVILTDGSHLRNLQQPSSSSQMDPIHEMGSIHGIINTRGGEIDLPMYDAPSTSAYPSNCSWTTLNSVAPLLLSCWIASPKLSWGESIHEAIERHGCITSARGGTSRVEKGRVGWSYGGRFINILIHQLFFGFGSAD
ncbi:hypothetical protein BDN71DRAFT_1436936 [Pleurotus eryngii]|uniref:Uncharacterized protein n=1 Tax=Pleurotus eryngii TaxID=5323 RepID=A0A9P5ZH51_PLEER|nr:hypothetical protein BDN71DRAFT_1436936 [Pleurotus eryngii]